MTKAEIFSTYGLPILGAALTALAGLLGAQVKALYQRWVDDRTKEAVVRTCVKAAEQLYYHLEGPERLEKAQEGQSYVILGRAGIKPLLDFPCLLIRVFIKGDKDFRIERVMAEQGYDAKQAEKYMNWVDFKRKSYHNQFCHVKWGDPESYDIILKSNKLGIDGTVDFLADYVHRRMEQE